MLFELVETTVGGVSSHALGQIPFVESRARRVNVLLVQARDADADMSDDGIAASDSNNLHELRADTVCQCRVQCS